MPMKDEKHILIPNVKIWKFYKMDPSYNSTPIKVLTAVLIAKEQMK
jgi:hypothetical protein